MLILVGLFFLAQSLGLVDWSIWEVLWRFWPAWLILIGLDMLLGRRGHWGSLVAIAVVVSLVGGLFYATAPFRTDDLRVQEVQAQRQIDQPLAGATAAQVFLEPSVSEFTLRGGALGGSLVQGTVLPLRGEQLEELHRVEDGTAFYRLGSTLGAPFGNQSGRGQWDLVLTDAVPIHLNVETGVAESQIDLSQLQVPDLEVKTGVGEMELVLPARGAVSGRISAGVGSITVRIPADRAARIRVETGLGAVDADGDLVRDGDVYTTPDYAGAADAIDLVVEGGVGEINLDVD